MHDEEQKTDPPDDSAALTSIDVPYEETDRALVLGPSSFRRRDPYEEIEVKRSDTANRLIQVLIWGFVLSFPFLTVTLFGFQWLFEPPNPSQAPGIDVLNLLVQFFEKWLAVMSALAGAAFGLYFGTGRPGSRK